jgi:hypothetical protein
MAYGVRPKMISLLLAEMIIVCTLATTPSVYQSLYWQTGVLTYVVPVVFATAFAGLLCTVAAADHEPHLAVILFGGFLAFIAAGFSESFAFLEVTSLSLAFLLSLTADQNNLLGKKNRTFLFAGLVGAISGAAAVFVAPGTNSRIAEELSAGVATSPVRTWFGVLKLSIHFGLDSIANACGSTRFVVAAASQPAFLPILLPPNTESIRGCPPALRRSRNGLYSEPSSDLP